MALIAERQEFVSPRISRASGFGDDIPNGFAEIGADRVQIKIGGAQGQIVKEDLIELIIIILARMNQNLIKVGVAFLYNGGEADNFRPGADDGHQFQTGHCYTSSKKVSGLSGSKHSLHHSSVTRFSVSLRFTILCVYPGIISTTVISSPLT